MELVRHIHLVIYSSIKGRELENEVRGTLCPGVGIRYIDSIEDLSLSLGDSLTGSTIFLIFTHDFSELEEVTNLKARLNVFKSTVLVLPDMEPVTLKLGLTLYPRYVTRTKKDYTDVYCVINKMISNYVTSH